MIEDTDATYEDLEKRFGKDVAELVNGVSKLTRIESQTVEGKQAENFRKLLLAMSEDIRVLLVKLADRLHNMYVRLRALKSLKSAAASPLKHWKFTSRWPSASACTRSRRS